MVFLSIDFNANWWAILAGGFATLFFIVGLAALCSPRRDWGYILIGVASLAMAAMFGGNTTYLLTNDVINWPWLGHVLLFRNIAGTLAFLATITTIIVVWRNDR